MKVGSSPTLAGQRRAAEDHVVVPPNMEGAQHSLHKRRSLPNNVAVVGSIEGHGQMIESQGRGPFGFGAFLHGYLQPLSIANHRLPAIHVIRCRSLSVCRIKLCSID